MWLKIAEKYKIGYINKKLALYRKSNNSFSGRKDTRIKILKDKEKIIYTHIKNGKYVQKYIDLAMINIWKNYLNYFFVNLKEMSF